MHYHIYYFSATGNTANSVSMIKTALLQAGHTVTTVSINRWARPLAEKPARLILAYPSLAWRPPALVMRFINKLPRANIKAAVLTTDGGGSFGSLEVAVRKLKSRGYHPTIISTAHYSHNWVQVFPPPTGSQRDTQTRNGRQLTEAFITALLAERPLDTREKKLEYKLFNFIGILFNLVGRRFLGKLYVADNDCTSCGLCSQSCPVKAISMGKGKGARPYWKINCESCNRCINTCPTGAINSSLSRGILLLLVIFLSCLFLARAYGTFISPLYAAAASALGLLLDIAGYSAAIILGHIIPFAIIDPLILRPLMLLKPFRRLIQKSFTKKFPRYTYKGYKAPKEHDDRRMRPTR